MNQKKSKRKRIKSISKKLLIRKFFVIFFLAIIASIISYISINNKSDETLNTNQIFEEKKDELKPEKISTIDDLKLFQEKKLEDYFDEVVMKNPHEKFEEYTNEFEKDILDMDSNEESINKENEKIQKKVEEIKEEKKKEPLEKKEVKKESKPTTSYNEKDYVTTKDTFIYDSKSRPKLAIIIDDVSTKAQKDRILSIGYKISMAFLPPTSGHPNSARLALDLPFYMIHFPMQASKAFKGEEVDTLTINDSYEKIENRVKQLRAWYPNAIYTNNHTGSVFTENDESMEKLFKALKKYNFIFVDSRTSAKSVAKKYATKYNMPYIVRNTFIDNELSYKAIQNQLKSSIDIAKKKGFAIAIGHPHDMTLKVLNDSKALLKDVDLIYVNQLPYLK